MFGLFVALFGGAYATGKVLHGEFNKMRGNAYVNSLNFNQVLQREYESMARSPERRPELEKICGYRIDTKSSRDVNEAVRDAVTKAGFRYFDLDELCLDPEFNRANGYRQRSPVEADRFRRNRAKIEEKKRWRFEHPHGKEFPISPLEYLTKEAYIEAVDKAYSFQQYKETRMWKEVPHLGNELERRGYDRKYGIWVLDPWKYKSIDDYIAAIDEIDKKCAVYSFWTPKKGPPVKYDDIIDFEKKWDKLISENGSEDIDNIVRITHDWVIDRYKHGFCNKTLLVVWRDYCSNHGYDYEKYLTDEDRKLLNSDD